MGYLFEKQLSITFSGPHQRMKLTKFSLIPQQDYLISTESTLFTNEDFQTQSKALESGQKQTQSVCLLNKSSF